MILVDSSVWIDHLRTPDALLTQLLTDERVLLHPFVAGEIALGALSHRATVLAFLDSLEEPLLARHEEVVRLIERHRLHGAGIGYVDAHLVASAQITPGVSLWTRDRRLRLVAERLSLAAKLAH